MNSSSNIPITQEEAKPEIMSEHSSMSQQTDNQHITRNVGYFIRLQASLIDTFINTGIFLALTYAVFSNNPSIEDVLTSIAFCLYFIVFIYPALTALYIIFMTSKLGGTIGKLISGIKIVSNDENLLDIKQSTFRYVIGYFVAGLLYGFGFFWIIRDKENKGWHDHVSGTKVIHSNKALQYLGTISLMILIAINILLGSRTVQSIKVNKELITDVQSIIADIESSLLENQEPPATIDPQTEEIII